MAQNQNAGVLFDRKHVPDLTTASDVYVNVPLDSSGNTIWNTEKLLSKIFYFNATINNLLVRVLASDDGGETFPIIAYPETLVAVGSPVRATIGNYYGQMKIQVKPAASGQNGTLTTEAYGISVADLTLATSAKQDDLITAVGGQAAQVQIEITRPANTTQYAANDAIADNDPSITTHLLSGMARANGGSGRIVRACIKTDNVSWTTAVRLVIYKAAPADGFIADNAAFDAKYADKASIVGTITFPGFSAMGTGAAGGIRAAVVEGLYIPYACGAGVKDLYFQMYIPSGTPTPASGQKFYVHLGIEQD